MGVAAIAAKPVSGSGGGDMGTIAHQLWQKVLGASAADGRRAAAVVQAVISGSVAQRTGRAPSILAAVAMDHPVEFAIIQAAAGSIATIIGGPFAALGVGFALKLMAGGYLETPEELQREWDRADGHLLGGGNAD